MMPGHIVLAYSGGLDTSVGIHWLKTHHDAEVTALMLDLGQGIDNVADAKARALQNGAKDCIVVDARAAFAKHYLAPAIQANAVYEGVYPLATALGRPLIAQQLVATARAVGADAVAHGCTGKGNDQVRIEAGVRALAPDLEVLAPQRTNPMSRDEVLRYAGRHGLALPPARSSPYSVDANLWGRSAEGHDAEDPAMPAPEAAFAWTTAPAMAPPTGTTITLGFQDGLPVSLDGMAMPLVELITNLNVIAGAHGIGRIDHVENRLVGIKTREIYEAPAAVTVLAAKHALEALVLTRDEMHAKTAIEQAFATNIYDGKWFTPVQDAYLAFVQTVQKNTTGQDLAAGIVLH